MAATRWQEWDPVQGKYVWREGDNSGSDYVDPGLLPDGTYDRPRNPDYGSTPGGDYYLGFPNNTGWDQTTGTYHPDFGNQVTAPNEPPPTPPPGPVPNPGPNLGPGPSTTTDAGSGGGFTFPQFTAPQFAAPPPFSYESYAAPDKFSYDAFTAPTADQAAAEPGYAFARDEGQRALTNRASSLGALRTGGTLKDLAGWTNKFAEQNYGNVFNRAANTYTMNRGNAFDTWGANELQRAQTYDRNRNNAASNYATNYGISRDVFDRTYTGAKDVYGSKMDAATQTFNDLWRRYKAALDSTTSIATAGAGL